MYMVPWCVLFMFLACAHASYMRGPGAALSTPLLTWPIDGGRFTVKIAQGSDDRALTTRIVFTSPPPHMRSETGFTNVSRTYPALAVRANDPFVMNSVSEAPHALMRRTRISTRAVEHYLQVTPTTRDSELVSDWTPTSRWRAALFLGPSSGLWDHFRCWHITQSTLDILYMETRAAVCDAWVTKSSAQWPVHIYDYSVPRDAASGDGTTRVHAHRYDTMLIGYAVVTHPLGGGVRRRYPVIVDLESRRNYIPSELDFMEPRPHLTLFTADPARGAVLFDLARPEITRAFTINTDSQEIILGLPFFRSNFSTVTYDAVAHTLAVSWVNTEPTEALRIFVSLLALVQGTLIIRWMGSARFASISLIVDTLRAGANLSPLLLSFTARQTAYEMLAVFLSSVTLIAVGPYAHEDYGLLFVVIVTLWAAHVLFTLTFIGLSPAALEATRMGILDADMVVLLPPQHVLARQTIHVLVLGHGLLMALLMSSDSLLVMLFSVLVALAVLFHIFYHVSAMLVCTLGLSEVSPGHDGWFCHSSGWSIYFVLEVVAAAVMVAAFHGLLIVPVLDALNYFYWPLLVSALSVSFILAVMGAAAFMMLNEASTPAVSP